MKRINRVTLFLSVFIMLLGAMFFYYEKNPGVYNTLAQAGIDLDILDSLGKWEGELKPGEFFRLVDENGRELDQTSHEVFIGDEIIVEDNNRYKVVRVESDKNQAVCALVGRENIAWKEEWDQIPVLDVAQNKGKVGIYMTHNDESYVPTDGTESKPGNGGIMKVGNTFAESLKKIGIDSQISFNKHDPHDANAYHRSRKTAVQLLKTNPVALIDVHRDGVPDPNFYKTTINGKEGTKIRLVVGRQNPHMSANLEFAKQIKAYYDKTYPGLIKGIFMAKGNYNQDIAPRTILIEVGTHTNSRDAAENGVALFADGIPKLLGVSTAQRPQQGGEETPTTPGRGTGSSLLWLLAFVVIGGGAFLLISTGSLKGSMAKISGLGKEFANYLGPSKGQKKGDKGDQD
jgi:stage II sporulation protein P